MTVVVSKEGFLEAVNRLLTGWRHSREEELMGNRSKSLRSGARVFGGTLPRVSTPYQALL